MFQTKSECDQEFYFYKTVMPSVFVVIMLLEGYSFEDVVESQREKHGNKEVRSVTRWRRTQQWHKPPPLLPCFEDSHETQS